jgi:hypothetical protein
LEALQSFHEETPPSVENVARRQDQPLLHAKWHRPVQRQYDGEKNDESYGIEKHERRRSNKGTGNGAGLCIAGASLTINWAPRSSCGARVFNLESSCSSSRFCEVVFGWLWRGVKVDNWLRAKVGMVHTVGKDVWHALAPTEIGCFCPD